MKSRLLKCYEKYKKVQITLIKVYFVVFSFFGIIWLINNLIDYFKVF
jgi:hypothetical protein